MAPSRGPILGLDVGTGTVSAALAEPGGDPQPLLMSVRGKTAAHYPAEIIIDTHGDPRRPSYRGKVTERIGAITRFLGQPPTVIGGAPRGAHELFEMMLRPAFDAAENTAGRRPDRVAAVVPTHWPDYVVDAYRQALFSLGVDVTTIAADEAHAAAANDFTTDGVVTCLSLGATSATLTLADHGSHGRVPLVHRADPRGGQRPTDSRLIAEIAARLDPDFRPDRAWLAKASRVGKALRTTAHTVEANDLVAVTLPEPFGPQKMIAGQVTDLVEDMVGITLRRLISAEDVAVTWEEDEDRGIAKTLLVIGGFSTDRAVGTAIRTHIAPWRDIEHPEAEAAMAAARMVADARVPR